jgi:hypothetical protein
MTKKTKILTLALGTLTALLGASAHAGLELENAYYYPRTYKAICTDCSTWERDEMVMVDGKLNTPNVDIDFNNHYLFSGKIVINERDTETGSTRKTVIPGVLLRLHATGLIAEMSFNGNSRLQITGLSGNSVADIFTSQFHGAKIGANIWVNLKAMAAFNEHGLGLMDTERLLGFGIGAQIVYARASFGFDGVSNETISVDNNAVTVNVDGKEVPLKTALEMKF